MLFKVAADGARLKSGNLSGAIRQIKPEERRSAACGAFPGPIP